LRLQKRYSRPALEQACEKIQDLGSLTPRLHDIEAVIKTNINPQSATVYPINRGKNRFLRGQQSWSNIPHQQGEPT
jgi:hypothetical protein